MNAEPSRATHVSIAHGWRLMWGSWEPCGASCGFSSRVVGTNMTLEKNYENMLRPILRFMLALMWLTLGFLRLDFGPPLDTRKNNKSNNMLFDVGYLEPCGPHFNVNLRVFSNTYSACYWV